MSAACSVEHCPDKPRAKGLCNRHYKRWLKYGDPTGTPTQDVDEIAVQRAMNGQPPSRMTPAERAAATLALHRQGLTGPQIAEQLRISRRTVQRIREAAGVAAKRDQALVASRKSAVLQLSTDGLTGRQIAARLGISDSRVSVIRRAA
ncbi:helix-turn-helix domain-containing protein [Streptomyces formicae]|uniref:Helix-turn-helix domain-containing protein n=1 Tax=Streptomyces formicae TaxID=1616117 RepID=A0ABY3WMI1_9ACTN|nr:helix-turn-helix domain-containing protein [Streptomyces formicae]UNM13816.1 helix-turn-helix domain-containing protein [Streptomyces formicae]